MAIAATVNWEVRTTGVDTNGGGFDPTSGVPGTDYSQQDAAQVTYTDLVIDAAVNTNCTSAAFPFTAAHVGNIINITSGAGFTVQRVQVMSVAGAVATCDKSLGTLASTGGTGNLGGGLKTIGGLGLVVAAVGVAGQIAWFKYHATNVYSSTSTSNNVANGKITVAVGSASLPFSIIGYETTHGDNTANRPIIRWGVNAGLNTLITLSNQHTVKNLIIDCNRANFTQGKGISASASGNIDNCKFMGSPSSALVCTAGTHYVENCEVTDCATTTAVSISTAGQEVQIINCYFHDNTIDALTLGVTARLLIQGCRFDTVTGSHIICNQTGTTDGPNVVDCSFYNSSLDAVNLAGNCMALFRNNVFETGTGYAIKTSIAGIQYQLILRRNAFYNFSSGPYDATKVLARNVIDEVTQSAGTFFVDAPNADFTVNTTAGQGALVRGIAETPPGSPVVSYRDYGAIQHQDSGSGTTYGHIIGS